jgi:hypothetical protein
VVESGDRRSMERAPPGPGLDRVPTAQHPSVAAPDAYG